MKIKLKKKTAPTTKRSDVRVFEVIRCAHCGKLHQISDAAKLCSVLLYVNEGHEGPAYCCGKECLMGWLKELSTIVCLSREKLLKRLPPKIVHHEVSKDR